MSAPAQRANRSDVALVCMCITLGALTLPEFVCRPLFGDDAGLWWGAGQVTHGERPFVDFWTMDPPGTWLFFMFGRLVVGGSAIGYWGYIAFHLVCTAILAGLLAKQSTGSWAAAGVAGLFVMVVMARSIQPFFLVGKDYVAVPFVLGGLLALRLRSRLVVGSALFGVAASI